MKCPYCKKPLYQANKNYKGMDTWECMGDNRVWNVKTGTKKLNK